MVLVDVIEGVGALVLEIRLRNTVYVNVGNLLVLIVGGPSYRAAVACMNGTCA